MICFPFLQHTQSFDSGLCNCSTQASEYTLCFENIMQKPGQISVIIWTGNTKQRWVTNEQNKQAAAFDNF